MNAQPQQIDFPGTDTFPAIFEHLDYEFKKLDLLILRKISEFRRSITDSPRSKTSATCYISEEEIDWLMIGLNSPPDDTGEVDAIDARIDEVDELINDRLTHWLGEGTVPPLIQLAKLFGLSRFEMDALIICLAPELRRKYDRIFAYLQDDITRQRPSADLILQLCCHHEQQRWQLRSALTNSGTLMRAGLLQPIDDVQSPSGCSDLAKFLRLDPRILNYVLGDNAIDARIQDFAWIATSASNPRELELDSNTACEIRDLIGRHFSDETGLSSKLLLHLRGPTGVGKTQAALAVCGHLKSPLLILDGERLPATTSDIDKLIKLACRESLLLQAPLLIQAFDSILEVDMHAKPLCARLTWLATEFGWLTFVAGQKAWRPTNICEPIVFETVEISIPDVAQRRVIWHKHITDVCGEKNNVDIESLARSYRLGSNQIRQIVHSTHLPHQPDQEVSTARTSMFADTCRGSSNQQLSEMATKVNVQYGWNDIVLPEDTVQVLRDICNQSRQQFRVLSDWGFQNKLPYGRGLSVLFTGPPGTGKTMAAQIIARDLNLDLYKIDLSRVVSKYIGETEKNLSRIFAEADTSNAVVFFDEADALFGKRTEVSDAHDRYANIEVSYLLQRMEEYDGIVILATNLRKNMDDAFIRRIRFIVEYPFPDEQSRGEIWRRLFPDDAPVSDAIDFDSLSRNIKVTGGNIKNIVLNAAFRAAETNSEICMEHIVTSTRREFEKIGKLWKEGVISNATPAVRKAV